MARAAVPFSVAQLKQPLAMDPWATSDDVASAFAALYPLADGQGFGVRLKGACAQPCSASEACVSGGCVGDRCTTGLLDHIVDGRLASSADRELFCAGCNLQTLYVTGYRRMLAGEGY